MNNSENSGANEDSTINTGACHKKLMHKIAGYLVEFYELNQYSGEIINLLAINRD